MEKLTDWEIEVYIARECDRGQPGPGDEEPPLEKLRFRGTEAEARQRAYELVRKHKGWNPPVSDFDGETELPLYHPDFGNYTIEADIREYHPRE